MQFGLNVVPVRLEELVPLARSAEELGFESLWVGEHVLTPVELSHPYPGSTGKPPFLPDSRFTEPFATLAHLAAVTSTIRLGTGILVLPLHSAMTVARALATVDVLSGGRVSLGVGAGWMREEFDAVGQDFTTRGRRMDEMLEVLDAVFTQPRPRFAGTYHQLPEMGFEPKPVQRPHPPFLVGGSSPAALRRAARYGEGWYGGQEPPEETAAVVAELSRLRAEFGRAEEPFEITVLTGWGRSFDPDLVAGYEAAGVHRMVVTPWVRSSSALTAIAEFANAAGLAPVAAAGPAAGR
jgi:probable F420-dependent oxidoreductase